MRKSCALLLPVPYGEVVRPRAVGHHDRDLRLRGVDGDELRAKLGHLKLAHERARRGVPDPDRPVVPRAEKQAALFVVFETPHGTRVAGIHDAAHVGFGSSRGKPPARRTRHRRSTASRTKRSSILTPPAARRRDTQGGSQKSRNGSSLTRAFHVRGDLLVELFAPAARRRPPPP